MVLSALACISAIAWAYTIALSETGGHAVHAALTAEPRAWSGADFAAAFAMWSVMMIAMMLPSATPMVLGLAKIGRDRSVSASPLAPALAFVLGYAGIWTAFSAFAALAQWGLHQATWTSMTGASTNRAFAGVVLLGAGAFQLTPLKDACLQRCRSPLWFLMTHWQPGSLGALKMGIAHGRFCIGCCWALMALMFVGGSMNLLWTAALALFMLTEKVMPAGREIGRIAGIVLIAWGAFTLATMAVA